MEKDLLVHLELLELLEVRELEELLDLQEVLELLELLDHQEKMENLVERLLSMILKTQHLQEPQVIQVLVNLK